MTVSSTLNKIVYDGDNTTVAFTYQYQMTDITWMQVYLGEVLQSSGYTVTMQPDGIGGTVTFDAAPAQDVLVTLLRIVPTTQGIDYTPYDAFPADTAEGGYDKLTLIAQQLEENLSRVPQEPIGAPEQPEEGYQHNLTISRDTGDCHPIAAITDLQTELNTLTTGVGDNASAISTNASNITANADAIVANADAIVAIPEGIGEGQAWVNVTGDRSIQTDYTNDTGRSIQISISRLIHQAGVARTSNLQVDGVTVADNGTAGIPEIDIRETSSAIVPAGSVYRAGGTATLTNWAELR